MDLEECSQITDSTLSAVALGCPSLEKLVSFATKVNVTLLILKFVLFFTDFVALRTDH